MPGLNFAINVKITSTKNQIKKSQILLNHRLAIMIQNMHKKDLFQKSQNPRPPVNRLYILGENLRRKDPIPTAIKIIETGKRKNASIRVAGK